MREQRKSRPGRSPCGPFRNCRHDAGSVALIRRGHRLREAATPNRAVRMAGSFAASANPHDCGDDRICTAIDNAIPALT
jgi:hypothetical protein